MGDAKVAEVPSEGSEMPQMPPEAPPPTIEEIATPDILEAIIKGYNPDFELVDFSGELGTSLGDNYMSIMYSMRINIKNRKTDATECLDIMLKTMPRNSFRQQMINECGAFIKDAKMYNEVFPAMIAFQKQKGLKDCEVFQAWPSCYASFHDGKTDYLAMKNLRVSGYGMASRTAGLNESHTILVLKNIARFHAISFAMFKGDYDEIMAKYPFLEEKMWLTEDKVSDGYKMFMQTVYVNEGDTIRKEGHIEAADNLYRVFDDKFWERINKLVGSKVKNAVITHGDCWTNNFLFKLDGSGQPKSLKFVDFQLARCSSRCIDLNYFFYSSPEYLLFNNKEEEFLKIYFDEFNSFVSKLGINPEEYDLTWDNLKEEFDTCRFYGVVTGLMLAPMLCAESSTVPDMETMKEEDFNNDSAKDFIGNMMGELATKKICNMALKHLPRCKEMKNQ